MRQSSNAARRVTSAGLKAAVHRSRPLSRAGVLERLFTAAFRRLVYPQIWEDPVVDLEALRLGPGRSRRRHRLGRLQRPLLSDRRPGGDRRRRPQRRACRARPAQALRAQASAGLRVLPTFFGRRRLARQRRRLRSRDCAPQLDAATRAYWDGRPFPHRRRIDLFARNLYRFGLLGHCIAAGHTLARLHGCDPRVMLTARSRERAARPVRAPSRADLRQAGGALADQAAGLALWARHSAGAISGARRRLAKAASPRC